MTIFAEALTLWLFVVFALAGTWSLACGMWRRRKAWKRGERFRG